jgi:hypothetical protein
VRNGFIGGCGWAGAVINVSSEQRGRSVPRRRLTQVAVDGGRVPPNSPAIWATVCLRLPSASHSSYICCAELGLARSELGLLTACAAAAAGDLVEPVQGPLGHQRVLELRDRPEDLGEHPAEGGGGVHALVEYHDGSSRRAGGQVGGG